jgi:hypothetical protein
VHFAVYEAGKRALGEASDASFGGAALAGAAATVVSDACMTPFDVIKQRLQARAPCGVPSCCWNAACWLCSWGNLGHGALHAAPWQI